MGTDHRTERGSVLSSALTAARSLADQLERAGRHLLGDSLLASDMARMAQQLRQRSERLAMRGESPIPTIAILGKVAEGKGWIARCFLRDQPENAEVRQQLPSGQNDTDRSSRLVWFGPESPLGLEEGEHYVRVSASRMLDLGHPYIVGDAPGYSDEASRSRQLAQVAVSSAAIKIIVFSEEIVRDGSLTRFIQKMPGAVVLPVVRFRPTAPGLADPDPERREDIRSYVADWRRDAPETNVLDPCFVPDAGIYSPNTEEAVVLVQARLRERLIPYVQGTQLLFEAVEQQIMAQCHAVRQDAAQRLAEFQRRVGPCVQALEEIRRELPQRLVKELLGTDLQLRAAVRRRFQAMWMDLTPGWCFPYRSFLGLLVLTAGAWDRLVLSLAGSLPSLALTVFQSLSNFRDARARDERLRAGVAQRLEQLAQDELRAELINFSRALEAVRSRENGERIAAEDVSEPVVRMEGLEVFENQCREIFEQESQRLGPAPWIPRAIAVGATFLFVLLLSGPLLAVYREYLLTTWKVLTTASSSWSDFPIPSASMIFTSLLLSAAPVFGVALLALGWGCRAGRVNRLIAAIRRQHDAAIHEWTSNRSLHFDLNDSRLDSARFLLQLGRRP